MKSIVLGLIAAAALMSVGTPAMAGRYGYRAGVYVGGYPGYYGVYRPYYGPAYYPPPYAYPPAVYPAPAYPAPVYPAPVYPAAGFGYYRPGFSFSIGR